MTLAHFKDLCVDATDARRLGTFWAGALGLQLHPLDDGDVQLTGPTPQHTIWVNTVPEPVTVKQRVHLDIHAARVEDVLALGASVVDRDSFPWAVLRDPEGGELCVFERTEVPADRLYEVVVDSSEPPVVAAWWADVLGARSGEGDGGVAWIDEIPGAPFENIVFVPVPEPRTVKNRIHLDLVTPDVAALVDHGARVLRERDDAVDWTVLADPEGNEFCAFLPADA